MCARILVLGSVSSVSFRSYCKQCLDTLLQRDAIVGHAVSYCKQCLDMVLAPPVHLVFSCICAARHGCHAALSVPCALMARYEWCCALCEGMAG